MDSSTSIGNYAPEQSITQEVMFSKECPSLLTHHFRQLHDGSGISVEVINERGYESVLGKAPLKAAGFSEAQQRVLGILIPRHSVDGSIAGHQYRPDRPREDTKRGRLIKYENPPGSSMRLDVPPRCQKYLCDPSVPLFFTEGAKKGDSLASRGACAINLSSVWGFKGSNPLGGTTIQTDFDFIALKGRVCFVIYDSDYATNPQVRQAQDRLAEHLKRKGSNVKVAYLPARSDGGKQGVDDFLAAGHTIDELVALAAEVEIEHPVRRRGYVIEDQDGKSKLDLEQLVSDLLSEHYFATLVDTHEILIYRNGVWKSWGQEFIERECQRRIEGKALLTKYKVNEVIGHIQRTTYCDRSLFNREKWVINLENGLLDVRAKELRPHTPDVFSTIRIPLTYNPQADCPRTRQFFREVLRTDDIPIVEELFGYCLIPDYAIQRAFLFVGEGSNGKSTLLNLLKAFIGSDNCASVPWHALELDRFSKSALEGKLVNIFADLPSRGLNTTTAFKMLTGGDSIGTEKKFRDFYSFVNFARLVYSTNRPPKVYDEDSYAFWRRWVIIQFPNQFTGAREDKAMLSKIATDTERSGLLNLALKGLERLISNGDFSYTRNVDDTTEFYQRTADPVFAFIQDTCEIDLEGEIPKAELYEGYKRYCEAQKIPKLKPNAFARALQNQTNIRVISVRLKTGEERTTAWRGITWVKDVKDSRVFSLLKFSETKGQSEEENRIVVKEIKLEEKVGILDNPGIKAIEVALGETIDKVLAVWREKGAPVIALGPGETCFDLAKLLAQKDIKPEHLLAIREWLEQQQGGYLCQLTL